MRKNTRIEAAPGREEKSHVAVLHTKLRSWWIRSRSHHAGATVNAKPGGFAM
jgi:hypothetical protein